MKKTIQVLLFVLFLSVLSIFAQPQSAEKNALGAKLLAAVNSKNTSEALEHIKQGANLDYQQDDESPLTRAVWTKNLVLVKALLEAGANPNLPDLGCKCTPFHTAIRLNSIEMVKLFIKHRADPNQITSSGLNALHIAATWDIDIKIPALLLDAGANPNALNDSKQTPRDVAVNNGRSTIADLLLVTSKPQSRKDGIELFEAIKMKDKARAIPLIKSGINLNYDAEGDTTLTLSIRNRDTELAKTLLEAGANPNYADSRDGLTPLGIATQMSNTELVELLIDKYKADAKVKSKSGYTLLHTAAIFNGDEKITALLIAGGADPNIVTNDKKTPLGIALSAGKKSLASLLYMVSYPETKVLAEKEVGKTAEMITAEIARNKADSSPIKQSVNDDGARRRQAISAYNEAHRDLEFAIANYQSAVKKYNSAGEAQYLLKGTLARAYRSLNTARAIINNILTEHGKYLPRELHDHLLEDYGKIPRSPY